jgi:threonine synthase
LIDEYPTREQAAAACVADADSYDASHVRNPIFRRGVATLAGAWLEAGPLSDTILLPVGNGSLLLGLWEGIRALRSSGRIASLPRLVAVQAERCAPIANPGSADQGRTMADGCAIPNPPAADEIRAAIAESGGQAIAIPEDQIRRTWEEAWRQGFPIEPTSALAFAGLEHLKGGSGAVAVIATGSGLKAYPRPGAV